MAGLWDVVLPQAAQNIVTYPTVYGNTTGYGSSAGTLALETTKTRRRFQCLRMTPTSGVNDGVITWPIALTGGQAYTFSADFWGKLNIPYRIYVTTGGGTVLASTAITGNDYWQSSRPFVNFTPGSSGTYLLSTSKNNSADVNPYWTDGWQCETGSIVTTYIDGAQDGCFWDGNPYASTSERKASSRAGGVITSLDTYGFAIEQIAGVGMPPTKDVVLSFGLLDGGFYQRTKALPRQFSLQGILNPGVSTSLQQLHSYRKGLIDALKHDLVSPDQPAWLRYTIPGGSRSMWIRAIYQDKLTMSYSSKQGFTEMVQPTFICADPFFYEDGVFGSNLSFTNTLGSTNDILTRSKAGVWSNLNQGLNGTANAVLYGPDGNLYVAGGFTIAGGVTVNYVTKWNGTAFTNLGGGMGNVTQCLAFGPDGSLYAGGGFTTASGSSANHVAKWNGTSWSALGSGITGTTVNALAFGPDGALYVGGQFTAAGGSTANNIAKWDGANWSTLGSGMNLFVFALAFGPDGNLYAGGSFTGGSPANYIAKWNGSAWSSLSTGMSNSVSTLFFANDGNLYAGGQFATAGGVTVNNIAKWTGSAWQPLGTGTNAIVRTITQDPSGLIVAGGDFTVAGGLNLPDAIAAWNGSSWVYQDVNEPGNPANNFCIDFDPLGNMAIAFSGPNSAAFTGALTTLVNPGTANANPLFSVTGPGTLVMIKNYTTGDTLWFSNLVMLAGETLTLTLGPGPTTFTSTFRGNMLGYIAPGSNVQTFRIAPGSNSISAFIDNSTGATALAVNWDIRYHSIDGVA